MLSAFRLLTARLDGRVKSERLRQEGSALGVGGEESEDVGRFDERTIGADATCSSLALSVSAFSISPVESEASTGDNVPGDVDALASPSERPSLRDQSELASSHIELLASLSVASDEIDRDGLLGSSVVTSVCNGSGSATIMVVVGCGAALRAGAGSVRLTLASSTTSVSGAMKGSKISDSIIST